MSLLSRLAIVTGEDPHFVSFFVFITVDKSFVEAYDAAISCTIISGVIPDVESLNITNHKIYNFTSKELL